MKCDTKTMVKTAIGLGLLGVIAYFALPQFRSFILGISPFLLGLVCPLSMIFMMKAMSQHQEKPDAKSEPAKVYEPEPVKEVDARA
jgi:hypothetical protein